MSDSQHAFRTQIIDYDLRREIAQGKHKKQERETAYLNKNIGQWDVSMTTDQLGRLVISAW
jgi:hypothetical protein